MWGGKSSRELCQTIEIYDNRFIPALSKQIGSIKNYSEKLFVNAEILQLKNYENIMGISAFYANDYETLTAYLSLIVLSDEIQGKGYGKRLLIESERKAKLMGMKKMKLEVNQKNINAIEFYKALGYTIDSVTINESFYMSKLL